MVSLAGANPFYFAQYGNDSNDGLSWDTPKTNLQGFVQTSTTPITVYIGAGTWYVTNAHFNIPANKTLIGTNRDTVILTPATTNIRVINVAGTNVWLESLSIMGATNRTAGQDGGGVSGKPDTIITNCNIYSNHTSRNGGGVYRATIFNSIVANNTSVNGAGTHSCNVYNSDIIQNYATTLGGGGAYGNYYSCNIISNKVTSGAAFGGGINILNGVVSNCIVKYNASDTMVAGRGGGIYCEGTTNLIIDSEISMNITSNGTGGGINIFLGETIITNCIVSSNKSMTGGSNHGAGIYGNASTNSVFNSTISFNVNYAASGGGFYFTRKSLIDNCIISNNTIYGINSGGGGGFLSLDSMILNSVICNNSNLNTGSARGSGLGFGNPGATTILVSNCIVRENFSLAKDTTFGGAIAGNVITSYTNTFIKNSQIYNNICSNVYGGAVAWVTLINCLISNNLTLGTGYGAARQVFSVNSVFVNNRCTANGIEGSTLSWGSINCNYLGHTNKLSPPLHMNASAIAANNIVYGNLSDSISGDAGYQVSSNLFVDPLFLPDSYKLQQTSPCIDMGNDTYATNVDYYGRARIYGSHVDIGAAEWYPEDVPLTEATGKKKALLEFWE